ncbi:retinol dehydrogenase 12 [Geopyxis carbonaria]|nr:retinol dehydrogenase 12 [Geopyxis carbonaria]
MGFLSFLYRNIFITPSATPPTLSLAGKTALVTGGNTGLGLAPAHQLLGALAPGATVEVRTVDMADPASVVAFADTFDAPLDLAIARTASAATGNETCVQVNHVSTVLLGVLLLPALRQAGGRLTVVSTEMALWAAWKPAGGLLAYLNRAESYDKAERYAVSKLMGLAWTGLHRGWTGWDRAGVEGVKRVVARTGDVGARGVVYAAAVVGRESHGEYISENKIIKYGGPDRGFIDTPHGKKVQTKIWDETITELEKTVPDFKQRIGVVEPVAVAPEAPAV